LTCVKSRSQMSVKRGMWENTAVFGILSTHSRSRQQQLATHRHGTTHQAGHQITHHHAERLFHWGG
jgi:hypothetical protein